MTTATSCRPWASESGRQLVCRIGLELRVTRDLDLPLRGTEGAARCRRLGSDNR